MKKIRIRTFDFIKFEDWIKKDSLKREWIGHVGEYNCKVAAVSWGPNDTQYCIAISTDSNPTNIYANQIYRDGIRCNYTEVDKLRDWFNKATNEANIMFTEYIMRQYIIDGIVGEDGELIGD